MEVMNRYRILDNRGCKHNLSAVETPKVVDAVVRGMDKKTPQVEAGRTGRILFLSGCLPSGRSSWIKDVQKKRAAAAS
jgi:hypothetical protein